MSTRRLVVWITFLALFAMAAKESVDSDTWWHLRSGELIVSERNLPDIDRFSHTRAGEDWHGAEVGWIMQGILYLVFEKYGYGGLNVLQALMVTAAFGCVYRTLSGGEFARAFILVIAAASSGVYWAARPYLMTFLLAGVFLWIFEDFRWRKSNRLWLLPPLMAVWSNSHGGFPVGMILWGIYGLHEGVDWLKTWEGRALLADWLGRGIRGRVGWMLGTGILMMLGAAVNGMGFSIWRYPFNTVSIATLQKFIQEWQSPDFHNLQMQPFLWILFLTIGSLGVSKKKLVLSDFLLITIFGYMSFSAARNIALFALSAPVVIMRHLDEPLQNLARKFGMKEGVTRPSKFIGGLNLALAGLMVMAALVKVISVWPEEVNMRAVREQIPVDAAAFLAGHEFTGNLLNSYNWGGYLIWAVRDQPVFVDGRTDLYGDVIIGEWLKLVTGEPGWEELINNREIGVVFIEREWTLAKLLPGAGWRNVYEDEMAVIYVR